MLGVDNKNYIIDLLNGPMVFRSTIVKPYFEPKPYEQTALKQTVLKQTTFKQITLNKETLIRC